MVCSLWQGLSKVNPGHPGQEVPLPRIFIKRSTKSVGEAMPSPAESKVQGKRRKSPNIHEFDWETGSKV